MFKVGQEFIGVSNKTFVSLEDGKKKSVKPTHIFIVEKVSANSVWFKSVTSGNVLRRKIQTSGIYDMGTYVHNEYHYYTVYINVNDEHNYKNESVEPVAEVESVEPVAEVESVEPDYKYFVGLKTCFNSNGAYLGSNIVLDKVENKKYYTNNYSLDVFAWVEYGENLTQAFNRGIQHLKNDFRKVQLKYNHENAFKVGCFYDGFKVISINGNQLTLVDTTYKNEVTTKINEYERNGKSYQYIDIKVLGVKSRIFAHEIENGKKYELDLIREYENTLNVIYEEKMQEIINTCTTEIIDNALEVINQEVENVEPVAEVENAEPVAEVENVEPVAEVENVEPVAEVENAEPVAEVENAEPVEPYKKPNTLKFEINTPNKYHIDGTYRGTNYIPRRISLNIILYNTTLENLFDEIKNIINTYLDKDMKDNVYHTLLDISNDRTKRNLENNGAYCNSLVYLSSNNGSYIDIFTNEDINGYEVYISYKYKSNLTINDFLKSFDIINEPVEEIPNAKPVEEIPKLEPVEVENPEPVEVEKPELICNYSKCPITQYDCFKCKIGKKCESYEFMVGSLVCMLHDCDSPMSSSYVIKKFEKMGVSTKDIIQLYDMYLSGVYIKPDENVIQYLNKNIEWLKSLVIDINTSYPELVQDVKRNLNALYGKSID